MKIITTFLKILNIKNYKKDLVMIVLCFLKLMKVKYHLKHGYACVTSVDMMSTVCFMDPKEIIRRSSVKNIYFTCKVWRHFENKYRIVDIISIFIFCILLFFYTYLIGDYTYFFRFFIIMDELKSFNTNCHRLYTYIWYL